MSKRLIVLALCATLPGGAQSAGEDRGRLTLQEAAGRLRQHIPVYACARRPDRFFGLPGPCPDGGEMKWVEDIQNGKAVFLPEGASKARAREGAL